MKNELIHYGVKGQKWGVRRYQNPDGTLTEAGKRKVNKKLKSLNEYESARKSYNSIINPDPNKSYAERKKDAKAYSRYVTKGAVAGGIVAGIPGAVLGATVNSIKPRATGKIYEQLVSKKLAWFEDRGITINQIDGYEWE